MNKESVGQAPDAELCPLARTGMLSKHYGLPNMFGSTLPGVNVAPWGFSSLLTRWPSYSQLYASQLRHVLVDIVVFIQQAIDLMFGGCVHAT